MGLCFVFELDKIRKKPFECYDKGNERNYAVDEQPSDSQRDGSMMQRKSLPRGEAFSLTLSQLQCRIKLRKEALLLRSLLKSSTLGVAMKMEL